MTTLHIVSKSLANADVQIALVTAQKKDAIVLIGDAVYALFDKSTIETKAKIFALSPDLNARGLDISTDTIQTIVELVDYAGFVKLTESHHPIVSWY
ncbi:hypothetical protein R50072_17600 [Simiduia litorea]|uniref:sulfurtransferase complex subunit TusB n=1 Tax=Simiduia litorea TaxID=1435348 RepID=UPI0036F2AAE7